MRDAKPNAAVLRIRPDTYEDNPLCAHTAACDNELSLNPTMSARVAVEPAWWWWMLHLIFGVTLGAVLLAFAYLGSSTRRGDRTLR